MQPSVSARHVLIVFSLVTAALSMPAYGYDYSCLERPTGAPCASDQGKPGKCGPNYSIHTPNDPNPAHNSVVRDCIPVPEMSDFLIPLFIVAGGLYTYRLRRQRIAA
jgi:hypothetical protein